MAGGVILLRDKNGLVTGVLSPVSDSLLIKQVKKPYSKNGYDVDKDKPAIRVQYGQSSTVASLFDLKTESIATSRQASIEGEGGNIDFDWSDKPTKIDLASGKNIKSDCNGPTEVLTEGTSKDKTVPGTK